MKKTIQLILVLSIFFSCKQNEKKKIERINSNKNNTNIEKGEIFKFSIPDTISLGKHIGRITEYNKQKESDKDYLLTVVVDNQYENSHIKKDTFSNGTLKPFFGINGFKVGKQKVRLIVEEQVLETVLKDKDSFLEIMKVRHKYEFKITVLKENYISKLEKELLIKMKDKNEK